MKPALTGYALLSTASQVGLFVPKQPSTVANAANLADLFQCVGINPMERLSDGCFRLVATGLTPGTTNIVEASRDLVHWVPVGTNFTSGNSFTFVDSSSTNFAARYYRVVPGP